MSRNRFINALGVSGILALAMATPSAAFGYSQTAASGTVSATFSWQGQNVPSGETLTITRSGTVAYQAPVSSAFCGTFCSVFPGQKFVFLAPLEPSQEPDVVLLLPNGGTGGGTAGQVFSWNGSAYQKHEYDFDSPARLASLSGDGQDALVSGDGRFECVFTPCAASGAPIKIELFGNGRFHNATRSYPAQIRRDAANWLKAFNSSRQAKSGNGFIAAWAADEEMLGHAKLVNSYLHQQLVAGHLRSLHGWPSGQRFINALMKMLRQDGYVPAHRRGPGPPVLPHCGGV